MSDSRFPLNMLDYRAIVRVFDEQEEELAHDETIVLEKVKRLIQRIEGGARRTGGTSRMVDLSASDAV